MNSFEQGTKSGQRKKLNLPLYFTLGISLLAGFPGLQPLEAASVYQNTFDTPDSLNEFTVHGEAFTTYTPPPLHAVSIDAGQLRIDTDYLRPNGPGTNPTLLGRAHLSLDTSVTFNSGYQTTLSQNNGLISWSFNLANQNGVFNNFFSCVLASTKADPYNTLGGFAQGYAFSGGGMVGDRMVIKRFDYGLGGGGEILVDITDGLATLPEKGSFNITFDPVTSEWSVYGESGTEYTEAAEVDTLLGTATDDTYTHIETKYFGLLGKSTGTNYFDNLTVNVVPEPASILFMVSAFLGAGFIRRRVGH